MQRQFRVILELNELGGYTVTVPILPGCVSEGDTKEEALANIKEAIELYLESLQADGEPIPILKQAGITVEKFAELV